jgi:hypothetical protein
MFFFVGVLVGLNLAIRVVLGEIREVQSRGHAAGGTVRVTPGEAIRMLLKGLIFVVVFTGIGYLLDLAFDTTIDRLFG